MKIGGLMTGLAIAIDLGTSGFRAQAIDRESGTILSTVITTKHPLPGGNVMDHIQFALEMGVETAQKLVIEGINRVMKGLRVSLDEVEVLGTCGNPAQLSIFQGMEIRDLAYAGRRKLESLSVTAPNREGGIVKAIKFPGLCLSGDCDVIIPPAVRHEVGADALALIVKTGMLSRDETSIAIDYGTNAEIALYHKDKIYTGSTAAGPALEGQQITCGTLAVPGAVSDLQQEGPSETCFRMVQLDSQMLPGRGALVDLREARFLSQELPRPIGITGTGTIATIYEGLECGLIDLPRIVTGDRRLHLGEDLYLVEDDLVEAGKAIGAIRAGYLTLCKRSNIGLDEIATAYMSGAAGTYVDAVKAQQIGMLPPGVRNVYQVGNTSLAMARDLVTRPDQLKELSRLAWQLKKNHCMFAVSAAFKKIYILELSHWTEGMPMQTYRSLLRRYDLPNLPPVSGKPQVIHRVNKDIEDLGVMGLVTIHDIRADKPASRAGCASCGRCGEDSPEKPRPDSYGLPGARPMGLFQYPGVPCRRFGRTTAQNRQDKYRFYRHKGRDWNESQSRRYGAGWR